MPKYEISIIENNAYSCIVEANSAEEAEQMYDDGLIPASAYLDNQLWGENYAQDATEVQNEIPILRQPKR